MHLHTSKDCTLWDNTHWMPKAYFATGVKISDLPLGVDSFTEEVALPRIDPEVNVDVDQKKKNQSPDPFVGIRR